MADKHYYLGEKSRKALKELIRKSRSGGGSERPPGIRRRPGGGGSSIHIILAQVDDSDGVASGDATFLFKNAVAIKGVAPDDGAGTAQNVFGETLVNEQFVLLIKGTDGEWYPDRASGTGAQLVHFQLTENKGYADEAKLAKPILSDGTLDSGADAFYVIDPMPDGEGQFYGLAAYTDSDSTAHRAYQGVAVKITEDWNSTEVPGWLIIAMEGPASELVVALQGSYSMGGTHCNIVDAGPFGEPFGVRMPRKENASYWLTVEDDLDVASAATVGQEWWVIWNKAEEHYTFRHPVQPGTSGSGALELHYCNVTIPAATWDYTTKQGDAGFVEDAITVMDWDTSLHAAPRLDGEAEIIRDACTWSGTPFRASTTEPVWALGFWKSVTSGVSDDETVFVVVNCFDLRALPDFDKTKIQVPLHDDATGAHRLGGRICADGS
jgi:hypothetical protein